MTLKFKAFYSVALAEGNITVLRKLQMSFFMSLASFPLSSVN